MLNDVEKIIKNAAQKIILPSFNKTIREHKSDGSIVTKADTDTQEYIKEKLYKLNPDVSFFGEEMREAEQLNTLNSNKSFWCLDPIDGTSNFAAGLPYFCTAISLIENSKVTLGLIYDPIRDECFKSEDGSLVFLNDEPIKKSTDSIQLDKSIAAIDFKRLSDELRTRIITDLPFASQRSFGSVALEWCWLMLNRFNIYLHGSQRIWDYSGGHYMFEKLGGHSCTLAGELIYSKDLIAKSAVAALDESLFKAWTDYLKIKHA